MSTIKITGQKKRNIEVFFTIITKHSFGELIKYNTEILKKEKLSLSIKNTIRRHIVKVGFIVGPNLEYANERFYEQCL